MFLFLLYITALLALLRFLKWLSYGYFKNKTLKRQKWDLNICCGKTDGGGINADIVFQKNIPNFILIADIYRLPFKDLQFKNILCSHTIEHVDNPKKFYDELKRVGENVTLITPPLWDLWAVLDFTVHKWIILSLKKEHEKLPLLIPYPLGVIYDKLFGQEIKT